MRQIIQYIGAIVFKRIFWNNPTTETVTLNAYVRVLGPIFQPCSQGRTRLKNWS